MTVSGRCTMSRMPHFSAGMTRGRGWSACYSGPALPITSRARLGAAEIRKSPLLLAALAMTANAHIMEMSTFMLHFCHLGKKSYSHSILSRPQPRPLSFCYLDHPQVSFLRLSFSPIHGAGTRWCQHDPKRNRDSGSSPSHLSSIT
jgi:hypothetical protein